jgi:hypothetical protein
MHRLLPIATLVGLAACAARSGEVTLSWDASARYPAGVIHVLPVLGTYEQPRVDLDEGLRDLTVSRDREQIRRERTYELVQVPGAIALALPGEVQVALGDAWSGRFRSARWPVGGRDRLAAALHRDGSLDDALASLARDDGLVLVTWVDDLRGDPLTAEALPGEVVHTASGPVIVDLFAEPYRVTAGVGMALVASDGEVVVRYADRFEGLLSASRDSDVVGRELARDLAEQAALLWPTDRSVAIAADLAHGDHPR